MGTMRVTVSVGDASVAWNGQDATSDSPNELRIGGYNFQAQTEQQLRDLYACLDFLFGRL